jgi:hypothetical protein
MVIKTPIYDTLSKVQKAAINHSLENAALPDDASSFKDWHASQKESLAKQAKQNPESIETLVKQYRNKQQIAGINSDAERYLESILKGGNIKSNRNNPRQR